MYKQFCAIWFSKISVRNCNNTSVLNYYLRLNSLNYHYKYPSVWSTYHWGPQALDKDVQRTVMTLHNFYFIHLYVMVVHNSMLHIFILFFILEQFNFCNCCFVGLHNREIEQKIMPRFQLQLHKRQWCILI